MQMNVHRAPSVTLLDLVATVSGLAHDEEEAAEVINHMLRSERVTFANEPPREDIEQLLS